MQHFLVIIIFCMKFLSGMCFVFFGRNFLKPFIRQEFTTSTSTSTANINKGFDQLPEEEEWPSFRNKNMSYFQSSFNELDNLKESKKHKQKFLGRIVAWFIRKIVVARTDYIQGLELNVWANRNWDILRGKIDTLEMKFDKISFCKIFVSGGGRLIIKGLNLRMRRFLFHNNLQSIRVPYIIYCDLIFTQLDIGKSTFIKNLIQLLVDTILARVLSQTNIAGVETSRIINAEIRAVKIQSRRIHAIGVAHLLSNPGSVSQTSNSGMPCMNVCMYICIYIHTDDFTYCMPHQDH